MVLRLDEATASYEDAEAHEAHAAYANAVWAYHDLMARASKARSSGSTCLANALEQDAALGRRLIQMFEKERTGGRVWEESSKDVVLPSD